MYHNVHWSVSTFILESKNHEIRALKDDIIRTLVFSGALQQNAIATTGMKMSQDEVPNARSTGRVAIIYFQP